MYLELDGREESFALRTMSSPTTALVARLARRRPACEIGGGRVLAALLSALVSLRGGSSISGRSLFLNSLAR